MVVAPGEHVRGPVLELAARLHVIRAHAPRRAHDGNGGGAGGGAGPVRGRSAFARVDLVKIDVDGFEDEVLTGAGETVERFRPAIFIELAPHLYDEETHSFARVIDFVAESRYTLRRLGGGGPLPLSSRLRSDIGRGRSLSALCVTEAPAQASA